MALPRPPPRETGQVNSPLNTIYQVAPYEPFRSPQISSFPNHQHAAAALASYDAMDYADAVMHAKLPYKDVLAAAAQINVQVEPQSWQADYKAKGESSKFVDSVDYQRSKP